MSKFRDLTGMKFERLNVIEYIGKNKHGSSIWRCLCDCDNEIIVTTSCLISGNTKSCGCLRKEITSKRFIKYESQDLINKKFNKLTVIEYLGIDDKGCHLYKCKCDCGKETIVNKYYLIYGEIKSCGCLVKEISTINGKKNKKYNIYDLSGEYGIGYDRKNNQFYFDLDNLELIKMHCWHVDKKGYVYANIPGSTIKMHRIIMNVDDPEIFIDHINHNPSDNRKINLRIVTIKENNINVKKRKDNKSNVPGVKFCNNNNKWFSDIQINNQRIFLGYFDSFDDAVTIRKQAEEQYFGEYSYDNSMEYAQQYQIEDNVGST